MEAAQRLTTALIVSFLLHNLCAESGKPNVLFLVVDDLRPKLGCYGETNMATPNIDQLAAKSVRFDQAYVQQALCSPSRTSFLTGRRPDTTRTYDLRVYFRHLAGNYTTLPQHFKNSGYLTQSVGKIFHPGATSGYTDDYPHSWSNPAWHPPAQKYWTSPICPGPNGTRVRNAVCPLERHEMPTGALPDEQSADFAIAFLRNRTVDQKPFFLAVGFHKPHLAFRYPTKYRDLYPLSKIRLANNPYVPLMLPDVAFSPYDYLRSFHDIQQLKISWPFGVIPDHYQYLLRQSYSAAVSFMDAQVGRVLQALDQLGLAHNTIISFHGDHGWLLGEHTEWTKHTNFDLAVRIPLMLHVPGNTSTVVLKGKMFPFQDAFAQRSDLHQKRPADSLSTDALVEAVDLYPTLSELAGLPVPPTCPPDPFKVSFCTEGASFVPLIHNVIRKANVTITSPGTKGRMVATNIRWKNAVFSQYPRPSFEPTHSTISPSLNNTRIMGYTMRTVDNRRYTEWVSYNHSTFSANWSQVYARELYDYNEDPEGNFNVVDVPVHAQLVAKLAQQLRAGWRKALPGVY